MVLRSVVVAAAGGLCSVAAGDVITTFNFDTVVVGGKNLSFVPVPNLANSPAGPGAFSTSGDLWGVVNESINDDVLDDSLNDIFDDFGVLPENFDGNAFAAEDLLNPDNPSGTASATWTFNIAGFTDVRLSLRAAAMGNFETAACTTPPCFPDQYVFRASVDGSAPVVLFSAAANETVSRTYTLTRGVQVTIPDPLSMNGVLLSNAFQTFTSGILQSGTTLTLTLSGQGEGSEEVFIFDDIVLTGTPSAPLCPADLDNDGSLSNGGVRDDAVDINDMLFFLSAFEAGHAGADLDNDGDPAAGTPDGAVTVDDLLYFLVRFEGGC
jgi:hypothetical protein